LEAWPWQKEEPSCHADPHEDHAALADAALLSAVHCENFELGLMIWLGWDTDNTDIDLHVSEPDGTEVFYENRWSNLGGYLSRDFTEGYGPEVYTLKTPAQGVYSVRTKYFGSHQDSALTGATSAVVWILHQQPASQGGRRHVQFSTVRLTKREAKLPIALVAHDCDLPEETENAAAMSAASEPEEEE
jgi:hypothetical protein